MSLVRKSGEAMAGRVKGGRRGSEDDITSPTQLSESKIVLGSTMKQPEYEKTLPADASSRVLLRFA